MSCLSLLIGRRLVACLTISSYVFYLIVIMEALAALALAGFPFTAADSFTAGVTFLYNLNTCLEGYLTYWVVIKLVWLVEFNIKLVWMVVVGGELINLAPPTCHS